MDRELIVDPVHFQYLRIQKGSLHDWSNNFEGWLSRYRNSIRNDFFLLSSWLPKECKSVLDVGSGLGGIDALLNDHFGGSLTVTLLDGRADPPQMTLHRKTFNDMDVARDFLRQNGVQSFSYYDAEVLGPPRKFDLIISLGSWCFHYPPSTYLDFIKSCVKPETVLIMDVRSDKIEWAEELGEAFDFQGNVIKTRKWTRKVFRGRD